MLKRIILIFLLLSFPVLAQQESVVGDTDHISYKLSGPLHRTAPYTDMEPGSVKELLNMIRPGIGVSGWKTRQGMTKHNTDTAMAAYEVESLHTYYDKVSDTPYLFAQCNDNMYLATNYPPTTGTTFGSSIYAMASGVGKVSSAVINDDIIFSQEGDYPWVYSGIVYADGAYIDRNTAGVTLQNAWEETRDNDSTNYVVFINGTSDYFYVISHKRLDTIYLDFVSGQVNAETATAAVYTRQSGSWTAVSGLSDGTADSGAAFAQSGSLTWTYSNNDELYILPNTNIQGFVYRISTSATLTANVQLYQLRVAGDAQKLTPTWDGIWLPSNGAFRDADTLDDITTEVTSGSQYVYADLEAITVIYLGFVQPVSAIYLQPVPGNNNTTEANTVTVKYWNTSTAAFTTVGTVSDSTLESTYSLARPGLIQWDGDNINEGLRNLGGNPIQMYWYELTYSAAFAAGTYLWDVGGAYKTDSILSKYKGVASYNNRAVYYPGKFYKNGFDYSAESKAHILNGVDAGMTGGIFGNGEVNFFTQFYSYGILSTENPPGLFVWEGKIPQKFDELRLTSDVGVVAPKTGIVIEDAVKLFSSERSVHAFIFLSHDGVYMTDGQTIRNSSLEISDYWDINTAPYIEPSYAHISYAWIDYRERTVHIAVPINTTGSGTQTTCNYELVYNYLTGEWYDRHIRTPAMASGLSLIGSNNARYVYTGDYSGFVWQNDYGTADGSSAIHSYLTTSDFNPYGKLTESFYLYKVAPKAKAQSSGDIDVYMYPNGKTSAVSPSGTASVGMAESGYNFIYGDGEAINLQGLEAESMSLKFDAGSSAVEPLEIYGFTIEVGKGTEAWE